MRSDGTINFTCTLHTYSAVSHTSAGLRRQEIHFDPVTLHKGDAIVPIFDKRENLTGVKIFRRIRGR